jgi:RNA polymerase sigma-70 factor (ECF subfamily)
VDAANRGFQDDGDGPVLVRRIAAGDRSAEARLWQRYARGLRIVVARHARDDTLAQDIVQDAFRIAIGHLRAGRLENPDAIVAYLRGIALNVLGDLKRGAQRETALDADAVAELPADALANPYESVSREERQGIVRRLIGELPTERDRELLWRYFVLDEDKPALCVALGLSPAHFDRVLYRAKARFRELVKEAGVSA